MLLLTTHTSVRTNERAPSTESRLAQDLASVQSAGSIDRVLWINTQNADVLSGPDFAIVKRHLSERDKLPIVERLNAQLVSPHIHPFPSSVLDILRSGSPPPLPDASMVPHDKRYRLMQPYPDLTPATYQHHLTANILSGEGKFVLPPLVYQSVDQSEVISIIHIGKSLCGHSGIIHGGLVATLFDEMLARTAIPQLPGFFGVTANLNINYRKPVKGDQFVVFRCKTAKRSGRKVFVEGVLETASTSPNKQPVVLADASALFVCPKYLALPFGLGRLIAYFAL